MKKITKPFFSVVVPVYNKEPHIARALNSILSQSYDNFELIVVCDPSSDKSTDEVEKFKDCRVRIFYRDEPGPGGYAARNLGITKARSEWVVFLDADDEWHSQHLERMVALIEEFPQARVISSGWYAREGNNLMEDPFSKLNKEGIFLNFSQYLLNEAAARRPICTIVAGIKKDTLLASGMFPHGKITMGGDVDTWLRCIQRAGGVAWSSHKGAIYNKDSINMVTRTSLVSPELHVSSVNEILKKERNLGVRHLLKKRTNNLVIFAWNQNMHLNAGANFSLSDKLFVKEQLLKTSFYIALSKLPLCVSVPIHRGLYRLVSWKRRKRL